MSEQVRRPERAMISRETLIVAAWQLQNGDLIDNDPERHGRYPATDTVYRADPVWDNPSLVVIEFFTHRKTVPASRVFTVIREKLRHVPIEGPLPLQTKGWH